MKKSYFTLEANVRQLDYSDNFRYVRGFGVIQKLIQNLKAKIISAEYARDFKQSVYYYKYRACRK